MEASQENGTRENGDEVFTARSKAPGASPASQGPEGERDGRTPGPAGRPPPGTSGRTEKLEERASTPGEATQGQKAGQDSEAAGQSPAQEAPEPPRTASPEREAGRGGPGQEEAAGEAPERAKTTEGKADGAGSAEDRPAHEGQGAEEPEQGAAGDGAPQRPPADGKGSRDPAQEEGQGKQEEGAALQPGSGHAMQEASGETSTVGGPGRSPRTAVPGPGGARATPCVFSPGANQLSVQRQRHGSCLERDAARQTVPDRTGGRDREGACLLRSAPC